MTSLCWESALASRRVSASAPSKSLATQHRVVVVDEPQRPLERLVQHPGSRGDVAVGPQRAVLADDRLQDAQHLAAAAVRPQRLEPTVVEHHRADAVARAEDAPGGERRGLGRRHRLQRQPRSEEHREALVHHHERRPVLLLVVDARVRLAGAGGDAPVDRAHVVPRQIGAHLLEIEAAPAHARGVPAGQQAPDRLARSEADAPRAVLQARERVEARVDPRDLDVRRGQWGRARAHRGAPASPGFSR